MSQRATRAKKLGAALLASSVAASLSPLFASPAGAAPPPAPSIAAVCANADNVNPFTDLATASGEALAAINCLTDVGIIRGTSATTFDPTGNLTRQQAAALIARLADAKKANEVTPGDLTAIPATGADQFTDDEGSTLEDDINRLAAVDIILGKTATLFDPTAMVTRGQFASLIDRMETYLETGTVTGTSPWATTTDFFTDDTGSVHEGAINRVASKGILRGDGNVSSAQADPISRTQAALVIARVAAVNHAAGIIKPLPRPPVSNQTLTVSPNTAASQANASTRVFTVTGLGTTPVDIRLFNCANVQTAAGGVVTFTGNTAAADVDTAAPGALGGSTITVVNGVSSGSTDQVAPQAGSITFTVTGPAANNPGTCVVPVVNADAADDDDLDIGANNQPTDAFGVGGQTNFRPANAAAGAIGTPGLLGVNVESTDKTANIFSGCGITTAAPESTVGGVCASYTYDANDTFTVDAVSVGLDAFEAALSTGDDVTGTYTTDPAGISNFLLTDESPTAPTGVAATVVDNDTINVVFDEVAGADTYTVFRRAEPVAACPAFSLTGVSPYTQAGTVPGGVADADAGGTNTFVDNGLTANTRYCYVVTAVDEGDSSAASTSSFATTNAGPADTAAPQSVDVELTTNVGLGGQIDTGDFISLCFNEAIASPADADAEVLQLTDADGTIVTLTQGGNATFTIGLADSTVVAAPPATTCPANQFLNVAVIGAIVPTTAGTITGLQIPANITDAGEIEDLAGNQYVPAGDPDIVVDLEAGAEPG